MYTIYIFYKYMTINASTPPAGRTQAPRITRVKRLHDQARWIITENMFFFPASFPGDVTDIFISAIHDSQNTNEYDYCYNSFTYIIIVIMQCFIYFLFIIKTKYFFDFFTPKWFFFSFFSFLKLQLSTTSLEIVNNIV